MRYIPRFVPLQFSRLKIARIPISRKTLALVSIAILIISTLLVTSYIYIDRSTQSLRVAGICNKQTSITLIDESDKSIEKDKFPQLYKIKRRLFKQYVENTSKYLFAKISELGQCKGDWNEDPDVELVFVFRPLIGKIKFESDRYFTQANSQYENILKSPWVKMRIDRSSKLILRAVFIWSERQFLFDQAMLSGASKTTHTQSLTPLDRNVFLSYYNDYYKHVWAVPAQNWEKRKLSSIEELDRAIAAARTEVASRIPIDIMYLFDKSYMAAEFDIVRYQLDKKLEQYATQYSGLSKLLLNTRLGSQDTEQRYEQILDLMPISDINIYRYIPY